MPIECLTPFSVDTMIGFEQAADIKESWYLNLKPDSCSSSECFCHERFHLFLLNYSLMKKREH